MQKCLTVSCSEWLLTKILQHITFEMIILQHPLPKEWRKWVDDKVSSLLSSNSLRTSNHGYNAQLKHELLLTKIGGQNPGAIFCACEELVNNMAVKARTTEKGNPDFCKKAMNSSEK